MWTKVSSLCSTFIQAESLRKTNDMYRDVLHI
jgi:hypothetical protein